MHALKEFQGHKILTWVTTGSLFVSVFAVTLKPQIAAAMPLCAFGWALAWLAAAVIFSLVSHKEFVTGFLVSLFSLLISWRILAMYGVETKVWLMFLSFASMLANFIHCAWLNIKNPHAYVRRMSLNTWHLTFIRMYLGFDFVPHFTEKLFAGPIPHMADVNAFVSLGVPHADFFVWLAGFCEFGAAIALSLGVLMRVGAIGTITYLAFATYLGHHFSLGFIWANHGGGWEFAVMWIMLIGSFALTGAHDFSLDQRLEDKFNLPRALRKLM